MFAGQVYACTLLILSFQWSDKHQIGSCPGTQCNREGDYHTLVVVVIQYYNDFFNVFFY
jgi:hypothetical protein